MKNVHRIIGFIFALAVLSHPLTCLADAKNGGRAIDKQELVSKHDFYGARMVMVIEESSVETTANKGVLVHDYTSKHELSYNYVGVNSGVSGESVYRLNRVGLNAFIERSIDGVTGLQSKTYFAFNSATRGVWNRSFRDSDAKLSGSFSFSSADQLSEDNLVPASQAGNTLVLNVLSSESAVLPDAAYPGEGSVILQHYDAGGNYEAQGFGPGTVDHFGTYSETKISSSVVVEETFQTIPSLNFTAPYTLTYLYDTPYSGYWFQNFGDGLIIFSGTFTRY